MIDIALLRDDFWRPGSPAPGPTPSWVRDVQAALQARYPGCDVAVRRQESTADVVVRMTRGRDMLAEVWPEAELRVLPGPLATVDYMLRRLDAMEHRLYHQSLV